MAIGLAFPSIAQNKNTVDPQVRQQIEAVQVNFGEAFNKHDAPAVAALFTQDAVEVWQGWTGDALDSGQEAIEKRYAVDFGSSPSIVGKLVQLYATGNDICAITEYRAGAWRGYKAMIYVRDADTWKIRMAYSN